MTKAEEFIIVEKRETLREVQKKVKEVFADDNLRICGIDSESLHFSDIKGFKNFIGEENFAAVVIKQNDKWMELMYIEGELTARVLI